MYSRCLRHSLFHRTFLLECHLRILTYTKVIKYKLLKKIILRIYCFVSWNYRKDVNLYTNNPLLHQRVIRLLQCVLSVPWPFQFYPSTVCGFSWFLPSTVCGFSVDCLWFLIRLFVVSYSTVCGFSFDCLWFLLRLFVVPPSTVCGFSFDCLWFLLYECYLQTRSRVYCIMCSV